MSRPNRSLRAFAYFCLLACLLTGLVWSVQVPVSAASSNIIISQVYGGGGNSGAPYTNDFVELFNLGTSSVSLSGWSVQYGGATGTTWNVTNLSGSLAPGQYYLVQLGSNGAIGSALPTPDAAGSTNMSATEGKVALVSAITALTGNGCPFASSVIDFVGYGTAANCFEGAGSAPAPSNTTADIRTNNCADTDNNSGEFATGAPSPHNTSSLPIACLRVISVDSSTAAPLPAINTYTTGANITITVTFSTNVNVDVTGGTPSILLETGVNDNQAVYVSGSGSPTLTFNYTVAPGDASGDLDYVSINSLRLNGATITGAVGDAILTLPVPGTAGSLGTNKNIIIDDQLSPTVTINQAGTQSDPTGIFPINFAVVFSEPIDASTFTASDIIQNGTATGITWNLTDSGNHVNFTISITAATGAGTIIPSIAANQVNDPVGNGNSTSTSTDNTVTYVTTSPAVTIEQAPGQADPTGGTPINFTVVFSEAINASSFTVSDITQNGTATGVTWRIVDSGDHTTFTLSAIAITAAGTTTVQPSILPNRVTDTAGNGNNASTSTDNIVTFNNALPPTVTINQAVGQADPTTTLPARFTVVFSEAIIASIFVPADITQNGTATGVTWTITDSGDHTIFTVSATAVTGFGTLVPSIPANRVTDLVGNNNTASTSTDNSIAYVVAPSNTPTPTPTRTPTPGVCGVGAPPISVIINEIAWGGTGASTSDEWIELYNPTSGPVNLNGWILRALDGTPNIPLLNFDLGAGQFYLLERSADTVVSDVPANQIFSGDIGNSGEVLQLYNSSGICVDTANSNGGAWPAGTSSNTFYSMERRKGLSDSYAAWITNVDPNSWKKHDARVPSSSNTLIHGTPGYENWAFSVTPTPSPVPSVTPVPTKFRTATPLPPPPPPLIAINEFVPRPGHDWNNDGVINVGDEYIELLNHGVIPVTLSGYTLDDEVNVGSAPFPLPPITLQPGERAVFYGSQTGLLLSDGGDGVRLLKPNGQLGDAYNYMVVRYPDQSYCRLPDNGGLDDWNENCFPTPGVKNALGSDVPNPPVSAEEPLCPISDTLPPDFILAECPSFGDIWSQFYWDEEGWLGEKVLPNENSEWDVIVD